MPFKPAVFHPSEDKFEKLTRVGFVSQPNADAREKWDYFKNYFNLMVTM